MNNYGWICPKCGKVNAPWISQCDCNNYYYTYEPYNPLIDTPWGTGETTWHSTGETACDDAKVKI